MPVLEIKVKLLWHIDYYDGPLSGICEYQERKCWFEISEHADIRTSSWLYEVRELTPAEILFEEEKQRRFAESVSNDNCYTTLASTRVVHPQSSWGKFYEWYDKLPNKGEMYRDRDPIGFFYL
jgi:hypothetical protein